MGGNLPLKGPLACPALQGSVGWQGPWPLTSGRVREDILPQTPGGQLTRAVRSSEGQFNLRTISSCKILINQSESESEVAQSCPTLCYPMDSSLHQAPLSMGFSRQEYWSGLPFPSPGNLPDPGIEPRSSALYTDALLSEPRGKSIINMLEIFLLSSSNP